MSGNFYTDLGNMFQEGFGLFDSECEGTFADSMKSAKNSKKVLKPKKTIRDFRNDLLQYKNTMSQDKEIDKVVADFASGYDAKDDKLDLLGWDILNSERISRKYVSLEDITHLSERPNTLRRAIFKRSFLKFITGGVMEFCALQGEELIEYLLDEVFSNPNLLKKNCYVKRSDGSVGAAYEEWDRCRASSTPDALRAKFQALVGGDTSTSIISYYASHGVKLSVDGLSEAFNKAVKEQCTRVCESGVGGFVQTKTVEKLKTLRRILDTLNKENRLGIYVGLAGSGKTHRAIEDWFVPSFNGGKNLIVSLSTLVALNGARRANTQGYSTTPCSIAMYNLCANTNRMKSWVSAYNVYCIDELSQWGLEQLDTFISIAQMALESGASFVCMGDISQIGSFLGRGNLLYMLMQNYPVTKLTENHRASSNDLIDFVWNVAGTRSRNFTRFRVDDAGLEDYVHRTPEDGEMVVTGSNACAGLINMLRMESALKEDEHDMLPIFYMPKRGDWNYFEMWRDNETWIRDRMSKRAIRVRPLENFKFGEGSSPSLEITYSKKFLRNESCLAIMDGWDVLIKSQMLPRDISSSVKGDALEMKSARISWGDFIGHFAPNYATTVNKAQGLEWKKVMVVYGDVGQIDPRQGEYVPSKNYNLNSKSASQATYVAVSRANDSLEIYTAGQQYGTQDAPMFADHMDCLKDFNGADPIKN